MIVRGILYNKYAIPERKTQTTRSAHLIVFKPRGTVRYLLNQMGFSTEFRIFPAREKLSFSLFTLKLTCDGHGQRGAGTPADSQPALSSP
jgi:hypothetical protein